MKGALINLSNFDFFLSKLRQFTLEVDKTS